MEVRARIRQRPGGRWVAETDGQPAVRVTAASSERCVAALRRSIQSSLRDAGSEVTVVVEVLPTLAGVAEAADVMGWDKRRVITYIDRGRFPEPLQTLASGRVWLRSDVEHFARSWMARQTERAAKKARQRKRSDRTRR